MVLGSDHTDRIVLATACAHIRGTRIREWQARRRGPGSDHCEIASPVLAQAVIEAIYRGRSPYTVSDLWFYVWHVARLHVGQQDQRDLAHADDEVWLRLAIVHESGALTMSARTG
jgi:hypothetical protein